MSQQYEHMKIYEGVGGGYFRYVETAGKAYYITVEHPQDPQQTLDEVVGRSVVVDGGWLLFSDGTRKERLSGVTHKPPEDEIQRAEMVVRFWQIKFDLAIQEFTNFKNHLFSRLHANLRNQESAPSVESLGKLLLLQEKVGLIKAELEKAEAEVEKLKPDSEVSREEIIAKNAQECQDFANAVRGIEV